MKNLFWLLFVAACTLALVGCEDPCKDGQCPPGHQHGQVRVLDGK